MSDLTWILNSWVGTTLMTLGVVCFVAVFFSVGRQMLWKAVVALWRVASRPAGKAIRRGLRAVGHGLVVAAVLVREKVHDRLVEYIRRRNLRADANATSSGGGR